MITEARLQEMEVAPREASILKAEMQELTAAYRARVPGLRVTNDADGVWLHIDAIGIQRGGIVGRALLDWSDFISGGPRNG